MCPSSAAGASRTPPRQAVACGLLNCAKTCCCRTSSRICRFRVCQRAAWSKTRTRTAETKRPVLACAAAQLAATRPLASFCAPPLGLTSPWPAPKPAASTCWRRSAHSSPSKTVRSRTCRRVRAHTTRSQTCRGDLCGQICPSLLAARAASRSAPRICCETCWKTSGRKPQSKIDRWHSFPSGPVSSFRTALHCGLHRWTSASLTVALNCGCFAGYWHERTRFACHTMRVKSS